MNFGDIFSQLILNLVGGYSQQMLGANYPGQWLGMVQRWDALREAEKARRGRYLSDVLQAGKGVIPSEAAAYFPRQEWIDYPELDKLMAPGAPESIGGVGPFTPSPEVMPFIPVESPIHKWRRTTTEQALGKGEGERTKLDLALMAETLGLPASALQPEKEEYPHALWSRWSPEEREAYSKRMAYGTTPEPTAYAQNLALKERNRLEYMKLDAQFGGKDWFDEKGMFLGNPRQRADYNRYKMLEQEFGPEKVKAPAPVINTRQLMSKLDPYSTMGIKREFRPKDKFQTIRPYEFTAPEVADSVYVAHGMPTRQLRDRLIADINGKKLGRDMQTIRANLIQQLGYDEDVADWIIGLSQFASP